MCFVFFVLMIGRLPEAPRTETLVPDTTRFRSGRRRRRGTGAGSAPGRPGHAALRGGGRRRRRRRCRPPAGMASTARDRSARRAPRSEEHTSELQSLMRISYAVFCLKKTNTSNQHTKSNQHELEILYKYYH